MSVSVLRHRFTVDDYHRMAESGVLPKDARVELLDGEIVDMTPIGSRHGACVDRLSRALFSQLGSRAIVRVQGSVRLSRHSEPQPDLAVLRDRADFYAERHPSPDDILLLVEVADTTLEFDRSVKIPLYARAGIREVWIVDIEAEVAEVYGEPRGPAYGRVERVGRGAQIAAGALPGLTVTVEDILG